MPGIVSLLECYLCHHPDASFQLSLVFNLLFPVFHVFLLLLSLNPGVGGIWRKEPAAILTEKTCPRVDLLLEEVLGVIPQPPSAHRVYSLGQPAPHSPTVPSCSVAGAQAQAWVCAAPLSPTGGPGFRDGSAERKSASLRSAHQAVSQGISLCLEKGCLFKICIEASYRPVCASACIPQGSQALEAHQTPSQGDRVGREALLPPD